MRKGLSLKLGAAVAAAGALVGTAVLGAPARAATPAIGHVFVIVLENQGYTATFGNPSVDPVLAQQLPSEGALLTQYYGTGHVSNDNYVAMVSGQGPNPQNQSDCQVYTDFVGSGPLVNGQAVGTGCVYPATVPTVANQLTAKGLTWKGYMEDMGNVPSRESASCGHPALNTQDQTQSAVAGDGYVSRHDPFVYFHSIVDDQSYCNSRVVPLGAPTATSGLAADLQSVATTPNLSFITPDVCDDGHDYPCTNEASGTSALGDIDNFLSTWVPMITNSAAFKQDGLLVVTFDESSFPSDSSSCCGETPGPDTPLPGVTGLGGGRTGAVLLSPFIAAGTVSNVAYNHYSLLASIEDYFGLARLGYASTVTSTFGSDIFK